MNKTLLIEKVAKDLDFFKSDVEQILNKFIETITHEVKKGNKVSIKGLGSFERVDKKAREGINPSNGQKIYIEAKKSPKFKIAKTFKQQVNEYVSE